MRPSASTSAPATPIPAEFDTDERNIIIHNPNITSLLATPDEMRRLGEYIADHVNSAPGPKAVALPLNGLDNYFKEGSQWHGVDVSPLLDAIRATLDPGIEVVEMDNNINDTAFADAVFELFTEAVGAAAESRVPAGHRDDRRLIPLSIPRPRRDAACDGGVPARPSRPRRIRMTQRLFLLRHGEVTSHRGDVPVTEEGLQTAVEVGRRLAGRADGAIRVISGETLPHPRHRRRGRPGRAGGRRGGDRGRRRVRAAQPRPLPRRGPREHGEQRGRVRRTDPWVHRGRRRQGGLLRRVADRPGPRRVVGAASRAPGDDAAAVADRIRTFAASLADRDDATAFTVGITHSPVLRACALEVAGTDIGEPNWLAGLEAEIWPDRSVRASAAPGPCPT